MNKNSSFFIMYLRIILISQLFYLSPLISQTNDFNGSIMYSKKLKKEASLSIHIDSAYNVSGTLTRSDLNKELKNKVIGKFDPSDNSIFIKEIRSNENTCPIYINGWVKNLFDNIFVIAGIYQSSNSKFCDSGHVNLINRNFKFNLYNKSVVHQELNDSLTFLTLQTALNSKIEKEKVFKTVSSNDKISLSIDKDTFVLKIYDNLRIDGDKVKITLNDIVVANNLDINSKASEYILVAKLGINTIQITAISEGSIPMNTSKVELYNYKIHEFYENKLLKNQKSTYIIHYAK